MAHTSGIELKLLRVRSGLRQYAVAQRLGIPPSTLCAIENGRRPLAAAQAERIAAAICAMAPASPTEVPHGA